MVRFGLRYALSGSKGLRELGNVTLQRIEIAAFAVERFGTTFGLISCPPEGDFLRMVSRGSPGRYWLSHEPWRRRRA